MIGNAPPWHDHLLNQSKPRQPFVGDDRWRSATNTQQYAVLHPAMNKLTQADERTCIKSDKRPTLLDIGTRWIPRHKHSRSSTVSKTSSSFVIANVRETPIHLLNMFKHCQQYLRPVSSYMITVSSRLHIHGVDIRITLNLSTSNHPRRRGELINCQMRSVHDFSRWHCFGCCRSFNLIRR